MGKMLECADGIHQNVGPKFGSPPPCNFGTGLGLDSERCGFHPPMAIFCRRKGWKNGGFLGKMMENNFFCLGQWWMFHMFRIIARGKLLLASILCIFWQTITVYEKSSARVA